MKKEDFIPLIEIQSVESKIITLNEKLKEEFSRLDHLRALNIENNLKIEGLQSDISNIELRLSSLEEMLLDLNTKKLKTSQDLMGASTSSVMKNLEGQIKEYSKKIHQFEEECIMLMEKSESLQENFLPLNEFKKNFPTTFKEIESEINRDNQKLVHQLKSYEERREELIELIPKNLWQCYSTKKKTIKTPLVFLTNKNCGFCKTQIDNFTISSIEKFNEINLCPTCKRILVSREILY